MNDNKEICMRCGKETISVLRSDIGYLCYQCYVENKDEKRGVVKKRKNNNEEARIQSEFFNQVHLFFPNVPDRLLFAVPNGGSRNKIEAVNLKRQGVKRGVSDAILLLPKNGFSALCIEFKTRVGKQSAEQKIFQQQAEQNGCRYVVVRSVKEAIEAVRNYLM